MMGLYMRYQLKSRILEKLLSAAAILVLSAAAILVLTGCMQDMAQRSYNSEEDGYEQKVVENAVQQIRQGNTLPPLVVNNPYALANSLGAANGAYAPNNPNNVQVINNNAAYGDLNAGIIQPGVFMQNNTPVYTPPTTFGSSIYSPTRR